jgi:hypothetical protein
MIEPSPKRRRHFARKWHRWLGLTAAIPVLWIALSGLMLNHAARLGFDDRMVTSGWILRHYNQIPEGKPYAFVVGDRIITGWSGELFLDQKFLPLQGEPVGAAAFKGQLIIATPEKIAIFDGSDDLLLELDDLSLPGTPIQGVEVVDDQLLLKAANQTFVLSDDFFSAEKATREIISVSPKELLAADEEALTKAIHNRRGMPLSRVILDAHSGSLFGWPGWVITDLSAVCLIILTLLGLRLFPKRKS